MYHLAQIQYQHVPASDLVLDLFIKIFIIVFSVNEQTAGKAVHQEQGCTGVFAHLYHGIPNSVAQVLFWCALAGGPEPIWPGHLSAHPHGYWRWSGGQGHLAHPWGTAHHRSAACHLLSQICHLCLWMLPQASFVNQMYRGFVCVSMFMNLHLVMPKNLYIKGKAHRAIKTSKW